MSLASDAPSIPAEGGVEHPPKPALTFRVGVVGHRPNRLGGADPERLAATIRAILTSVREELSLFAESDGGLAYAPRAPALTAVTALAEGVDRIFAEEALGLGFVLTCPLPFERSEFDRDFQPGRALEPGASERFFTLLDRADVVFELDGDRGNEPAAYGAAGQVVVRQSDLLIVVWDGHRRGMAGGTEEMLERARRAGISTLWIDANAPHVWQMLDSSPMPLPLEEAGRSVPLARDDRVRALREAVTRTVAVPEPPTSPTGPSKGAAQMHLEDYYRERPKRWRIPVWRSFRYLLGRVDGLGSVGVRTRALGADLGEEWDPGTDSPHRGLIERLRPAFAWTDALATYHSESYRSAFISAYLAAALAVGAAVFPIASGIEIGHHDPLETAAVLLELALILFILGVIRLGRRRIWHERWIDCRFAAELLRHLRISVPLAGARPVPVPPAHLSSYGRGSSTWAAWYVRAVERQVGIPNVVVSSMYLENALTKLRSIVVSQLDYHRKNAARCHNIEKSLHALGLTMLGLTLLACAVHLLPVFPTEVPPVLTAMAAFFPAVGAACSGINNQGEFRRIYMRSDAMVGQFEDALREVRELEELEALGEHLRSGTVGELADRVGQLMVREVQDWRVILLDRPLVEPA